jgi:tetratricopeptide (TPR) repeat protein
MHKFIKKMMAILGFFVIGTTPMIHAADSAPNPEVDIYRTQMDGGLADYNAGRFDAAAKKFEQAITIKSDRPIAFLNLALAQYKLKNVKKALESVRKGISAPPPHDADLYGFAATLYDENGDKAKAVEVLKQGLGEGGKDAAFYTDLSGRLLGREKYDAARTGLQHALLLEPENAKAHGMLAMAYGVELYQLPFALSSARMLQLDPKGDSAPALREGLIFVFDRDNSTDHTDEGDFRETEKLMSITGSGARMLLGKDTDEGSILNAGFQAMLGSQIPKLAKQKQKGFTSTYYIPFYAALVENHLVAPFVNLILSGEPDGRFEKWLKDHPDDRARLDKFLKDYHWPSAGDAAKTSH